VDSGSRDVAYKAPPARSFDVVADSPLLEDDGVCAAGYGSVNGSVRIPQAGFWIP
jgi:hypothetical protein